MSPERWNGLAWFRMNGYGKVLGHPWVGKHTGCPPTKTRSTRQKRVGLVRLFLCEVTLHFHRHTRASHGNSTCESAQNLSYDKKWRRLPSKKNQNKKPMFRALDRPSSRARGLIKGGYRRPGLLQINSPKKPINRVCPCEESTDEHRQPPQTAMGRPTKTGEGMTSPRGQAVR